MRWTTDADTILAIIKADAGLGAIFGAGANMALYKAGERDFEVPSLEYSILSETPAAEVFERIRIQFDPFVRSEANLRTVHDRLYALFNQDREWSSGGTQFRSRFVGAYSVPAAAGVYQGPLEFWFEVVRQLYH